MPDGDVQPREGPGRAFCYRCHKAASTCVCASIQPVANRTEVLVVQHPREQRHPIGSLRFARLGLTRCRIAVASADPAGGLRAALPFPPGAALLYPGAEARDLAQLSPGERPGALVLLDGTWSTVRRLLAGDPRLRALPKVSLTPKQAGRYRIRREPRAECMSTLEALLEALRVLEPDRNADWDALIGAFDTMIDHQIAVVQAKGRPRVRQPAAQRQFRAVPAALGLERGPIVVVAVESTQVNAFGSAGSRRRRQIVRLSATRLAAAMPPVHLDVLVAVPGTAPGDKQLAAMGVSRSALADGGDVAELVARWQALVQPGDRVCAWNQMTLSLALPLLADPDAVSSWVLKGIYADLRRQRAGDVHEACAREGIVLGGEPVAARGLTRLAAAVAMVQWLSLRREGTGARDRS